MSNVVDNVNLQYQLNDVRQYGYNNKNKSYLDLKVLQRNLSNQNFSQIIGFKNKETDSKDDITIATDGSVVNYSHEQHSTKGTTQGFGIFFQNFYKTTRTFGSINNMGFKNTTSQEVELFALYKAMQVLTKEYGYVDLKERNVNLFTDSINTLSALYPYLLLEIDKPQYAEKRKGFQYQSSDFFIQQAEEAISRQQYHCETSHKLFKQIAEFVVDKEINLIWIRGHSNWYQNETADTLSSLAKAQASADRNVKALRIPDATTICTSTQVLVKRRDPRDLYVEKRKILKTSFYKDIFSKHIYFNVSSNKQDSNIYSVDNNNNIKVNYNLSLKSNYDLGGKYFLNEIELIRNQKIDKRSLSADEYQNFGENLQRATQRDINNISTLLLSNTLNDVAVQANKEDRHIDELMICFSHSPSLSHLQDGLFLHLDKKISHILPPLTQFKETKLRYDLPFQKNEKTSIVRINFPLMKGGKVFCLSNTPEVNKIRAAELHSDNLKNAYLEKIVQKGLIVEQPHLNIKGIQALKTYKKFAPRIYSYAFSHFVEQMNEKRENAVMQQADKPKFFKNRNNGNRQENSFNPRP